MSTPHDLFPRHFAADAHLKPARNLHPWWLVAGRLGTNQPGTFFYSTLEEAQTEGARMLGLGFLVSDVYPNKSDPSPA